jgi:pimeloyl-ACP methyl ester carboxylesterase
MMLSHDRRGSGEPLLLIHGIGLHWQVWCPVLHRLGAANFETVAIDVPGFGFSSPLAPGEKPTIYALTQAVADFLDELGLREAHVVGNSMGGAIALELARAGRARSVTAISPAGLWTPKERRFCQVSLQATLQILNRFPKVAHTATSNALGRTLLASQLTGRPWRWPAGPMRDAIAAVTQAQGFLGTLGAFDDYVLRDAKQISDVPVTIAWGTRDRLLIPRQARRARRVMPWANHVWLKGAGHVPMWDDPELLASTIVGGARASRA